MEREVDDAIDHIKKLAENLELGGYTTVRYQDDGNEIKILLRKGWAEVILQAGRTQKKYEDDNET